jgi:hypothetical protein
MNHRCCTAVQARILIARESLKRAGKTWPTAPLRLGEICSVDQMEKDHFQAG